ncbi:MAG TPA: acetate uptake transporter [Ktedonobacteraceae bacterium]|nr:acetate uptake transporter [Ktedonobacteraceae bacterium]
MAQIGAERERVVPVAGVSSNPAPLGMSALAFTTAIIGSAFAGFIVPARHSASIGLAVAAALFFGGIVQLLAGMWEFRKENTLAATLFSSYGGFLIAFGAIFLPVLGINTLIPAGVVNPVLGLFFLCWTIFSAVMFIAALRTNMTLLLVLLFLFLSYLFLTIGELAGGNGPLLAIGGWLGIICALIAWYAALARLLESSNSPYRLPVGEMSSPHSML